METHIQALLFLSVNFVFEPDVCNRPHNTLRKCVGFLSINGIYLCFRIHVLLMINRSIYVQNFWILGKISGSNIFFCTIYKRDLQKKLINVD